MQQESAFAVSDLSPPLLAAVTGQFDQQVAPREHSLHTNFPAFELGLAQIGQLGCDRMFPLVGHDPVVANLQARRQMNALVGNRSSWLQRPGYRPYTRSR